jgi:hypothetical protein
MVPEWAPVIVVVHAPAAEAAVVVVTAVPDSAASVRVPVRIGRMILGNSWYMRGAPLGGISQAINKVIQSLGGRHIRSIAYKRPF